MTRTRLIATTLISLAISAPAFAEPQTYSLHVTPETVEWGHYDPAAKPVLTIHSGDTVIFDTVLTNSPTGLEKNGVPPDQVEKSLRDVFDHVSAADRGPGGHVLTGPVYVDGAEPGDVLEIRINRISLAIPYAYNGFRYGAGILTDDFPYARTKIIPLDRDKMTAAFAPAEGSTGAAAAAPASEVAWLASACICWVIIMLSMLA